MDFHGRSNKIPPFIVVFIDTARLTTGWFQKKTYKVPTLPRTVLVGTVSLKILFSQSTGILNASKISFINWTLSCILGLAVLLEGFAGPKLTGLITFGQFKFSFGVLCGILISLLIWQTTPSAVQANEAGNDLLETSRASQQQTIETDEETN